MNGVDKAVAHALVHDNLRIDVGRLELLRKFARRLKKKKRKETGLRVGTGQTAGG